MKFLLIPFLSFTFLLNCRSLAQENSPGLLLNLQKTILYHDSIFWSAYNKCDVETMAKYFTDDLEFYHDKSGLNSPKSTFVESIKTGLCGNADWRLRREEISGSVKVFLMNNYGALISGEHIFYINETGKKEYLDGYGKFTHLWRFENNSWKMSRIISYDHGPAPFISKRKAVSLTMVQLRELQGSYLSSKGQVASVTTADNLLKMTVDQFQIEMFPESPTNFFAKDRDLQMEFVRTNGRVAKVLIYEKGVVVDELKRM